MFVCSSVNNSKYGIFASDNISKQKLFLLKPLNPIDENIHILLVLSAELYKITILCMLYNYCNVCELAFRFIFFLTATYPCLYIIMPLLFIISYFVYYFYITYVIYFVLYDLRLNND